MEEQAVAKAEQRGAKGKVVARNRNGDLHMRAVRSDGWSEEERALFLDNLAATCNVDASAEAAGHNGQSAKGLRRRDIEFRAQWDDALDTGYATLEAMVLEKTQQAMSAKRPMPDDTSPSTVSCVADDVTFKDAIALLDKHRNMVIRIRQGKEAGNAVKAATAKESCTEIIERLRVLKMRLDEGE
jgi:hypothetical protein